LVRDLFWQLALDASADAVPFFLAALTPSLRLALRGFIESLTEADYRAGPFFIGGGLSETEEAELFLKAHELAKRLIAILRDIADGRVKLTEPDRVKGSLYWRFLSEIRTDGNPPCRSSECAERSIHNSIWCARHHYEAVVGKPVTTMWCTDRKNDPSARNK
jgi:hypothetical protein